MGNLQFTIEELVGIDQLSQILKLKKSYIYLLTHEKRIPHYKVKGHLRFRLSEIDKWLSTQFIGSKDAKNIDF